MEPITRQEQLLDSIATGNSVELEPITREEQYLSAIAGLTDIIPEKPITRKEMFYEKILESGGVGGDGTAKPTQSKTINVVENGTYKVTPDSGKVLSSVTAKVNVPERYDEGFAEGKDQGLSEGYSSGFGAGVNSVKLQEKTATENGEVLPDEGFSGMSKVTVAVPVKEEQDKTVTITENGTTEVIPDEGKTLSKVTVETNVPTGGSGEVGKPYIDTSKMQGFSRFFMDNPLLVVDIDKFDFTNGQKFDSFFNGVKSIDTIPPLDTAQGTAFDYAFYSCGVKEIQSLDFSSLQSGSSMFEACSKLETINIVGETTNIKSNFVLEITSTYVLKNVTIPQEWKNSIYMQKSGVITVESLHGVIENLADLTGATAKTFSVGATNLAKIDEEHIAILQAKNWNYS